MRSVGQAMIQGRGRHPQSHMAPRSCIYTLGVHVVGVRVIRAPLFGVYIRASDFFKLTSSSTCPTLDPMVRKGPCRHLMCIYIYIGREREMYFVMYLFIYLFIYLYLWPLKELPYQYFGVYVYKSSNPPLQVGLFGHRLEVEALVYAWRKAGFWNYTW